MKSLAYDQNIENKAKTLIKGLFGAITCIISLKVISVLVLFGQSRIVEIHGGF